MASPGTEPANRQDGAETAAQGKADSLTDLAREKAGEIKQQAADTIDDMRHEARSSVDRQKDAAVGRVEGVAHALRRASDDLREQGQPMFAEYSRQAAEGLESMAGSLSRRNVDDLVEGVEDFARERPAAFLGGAVVAGFALARFMKSSAARRYERTAAERRAAPAGTAGPAASPAPTGAPGIGGSGVPPTEGSL